MGLLIGLQILDIVVHVATMQVEPIRITSNLIIAAGTIFGVLNAGKRSRMVIALAAAAYLVLNLLFLAQHGLVNPSTEALRTALFVFVFMSMALVFWLGRLLK
ncbi:hypothetical protein [Sulfitobacter sp. JB4-11]|uniref:hypothetical protein n=1 Tax=Sulfitobacter rhodophyticola TaxID=3238304 RepID=UPI003D818178